MSNLSIDISGQIIATENTTDFPQMVVIVREIPLISGFSRLVKYYSIWPDLLIFVIKDFS